MKIDNDSFVIASLDRDLSSIYSRIAGSVRDVAGSKIKISVNWAVKKGENLKEGFSQYSDEHHNHCKYVTVEKEQILKVL